MSVRLLPTRQDILQSLFHQFCSLRHIFDCILKIHHWWIQKLCKLISEAFGRFLTLFPLQWQFAVVIWLLEILSIRENSRDRSGIYTIGSVMSLFPGGLGAVVASAGASPWSISRNPTRLLWRGGVERTWRGGIGPSWPNNVMFLIVCDVCRVNKRRYYASKTYISTGGGAHCRMWTRCSRLSWCGRYNRHNRSSDLRDRITLQLQEGIPRCFPLRVGLCSRRHSGCSCIRAERWVSSTRWCRA